MRGPYRQIQDFEFPVHFYFGHPPDLSETAADIYTANPPHPHPHHRPTALTSPRRPLSPRRIRRHPKGVLEEAGRHETSGRAVGESEGGSVESSGDYYLDFRCPFTHILSLGKKKMDYVAASYIASIDRTNSRISWFSELLLTLLPYNCLIYMFSFLPSVCVREK
ncbi:hypothetical protein B0T24DRAFT_723968, partial [Lasiosphaeria ovina]